MESDDWIPMPPPLFFGPALWVVRAAGDSDGVDAHPATGSSSPLPRLLTYDGTVSDTARTEGLLIARDGCLLLGSEQGEDMLIAWPTGTEISSSEGVISVVDGSGSSDGSRG